MRSQAPPTAAASCVVESADDDVAQGPVAAVSAVGAATPRIFQFPPPAAMVSSARCCCQEALEPPVCAATQMPKGFEQLAAAPALGCGITLPLRSRGLTVKEHSTSCG